MNLVISAPLNFTSAVAIKIKTLIEEEANLELKLFVLVQGDGYKEFQFGFTFDGALTKIISRWRRKVLCF